jgi:hypothetical protein
MKNKKQLIKGNKIVGVKEQSNEKYEDTNTKEQEECNVYYDTRNLIVAVADGVLTNINRQDKEIRLLFFHNIPIVDFGYDGGDKEKTQLTNKAIIEVRVTYSGFKNIISSMADLISDFNKFEKKKAPLIEFLKNEGNHQMMFG